MVFSDAGVLIFKRGLLELFDSELNRNYDAIPSAEDS